MQQAAFNQVSPSQEANRVVTPEEIALVIKQLLSSVNTNDMSVRSEARAKFFSYLYALDFYNNDIEIKIGLNLHEFESYKSEKLADLIPENILKAVSDFVEQIKPARALSLGNIAGSIRGAIRSNVTSILDSIKGIFKNT